jgi:hypothetical protein
MMECTVCGKEIPNNHPVLYNSDNNKSVCMGCESTEIEVWRVSLPNEKGGCVEKDFDSMIEMLREMDVDTSLEVHKEIMLATKYITLPEFTGF